MLDRTIVEASSAGNARIHAPAQESHETVQGTAPLNTDDALGKTPRADVVAEGHISTSSEAARSDAASRASIPRKERPGLN
jgi:hypothetical protein